MEKIVTDPAEKHHLERLMSAFKKWHADTADTAMLVPEIP